MAAEPNEQPPPWRTIAAVCAALLVLPLSSAAGLGEIGGYRMFSRLRPVELRIVAVEADGSVSRPGPGALEPHLGPDARRILLAALRGRAMGDAAESGARAALPQIAELVCAQRTGRQRVDVELIVEHRDGPPELVTERHACD